MLPEEGVCDQHYEYIDSGTIPLQSLGFLRLKKESDNEENMSGSWRADCIQRYRRGFVNIQDKSTHPRASSAFWSAPVSDNREV